MARQRTYQLGIDVGGTFTDIVLFDGEKTGFTYAKTATTPEDPSIGVINGLKKVGSDFACIERFVHASTFAVNLILERKGPKIGLITTKGCRDVLELMREVKREIYDFQCDKPQHFIPRSLRVGVSERIDSEGKIVEPLNCDEAVRAVKYLKEQGVQAIAVCFPLCFLNPDNEEMMRDIERKTHTEDEITLSNELLPEIRQ